MRFGGERKKKAKKVGIPSSVGVSRGQRLECRIVPAANGAGRGYIVVPLYPGPSTHGYLAVPYENVWIPSIIPSD